MRVIRRLGIDLGPLERSSSFRSLCLGQFISRIGRYITGLAAPYQVYQLTHSSVAVGILAFVPALPFLAGATYGGPLADRVDRRRILMHTQYALAACSVVLMLMAATNSATILGIYITVGVASLFLGIESPTRHALIPNLVSSADLPAATSIDQVLYRVSMVIGPAIGGALVTAFHLAGAYLIDAGTYGAALAAVYLLPPQPPAAINLKVRGALIEGLRFIRNTPVLLGVMMTQVVAAIAIPQALFPALAATVFHVDAFGLSLMYSAPNLGAAVATLILSRAVNSVRLKGRMVTGAVILWSLCIIAFGLSSRLGIALLFLVGSGVMIAVADLCRSIMGQRVTPDRIRGRANAVGSIVANVSTALGDGEGGLAALLLTPQMAVISGGVAALIAVSSIAVVLPSFRRYHDCA